MRFKPPEYYKTNKDKTNSTKNRIVVAGKLSGGAATGIFLYGNKKNILSSINKKEDVVSSYVRTLNFGDRLSQISADMFAEKQTPLMNNKFNSLREVLHSKLLRAEQGFTPLSWMQGSSILSPFLMSAPQKPVFIASLEIIDNLNYYKTMIDSANYHGFFDLNKEEILRYGLKVEDGKLFINYINKEVAGAAAIVQKGVFGGYKEKVISQPFMSYVSMMTGNYNSTGESGMGVIAASNKLEMTLDWARASAHSLSLRYYKLLDDPLEFIEQYTNIMPRKMSGAIRRSSIYQGIKNKLGAGGTHFYSKSMTELAGRHILSLGKNLLLPYLATKVVHEELKQVIPGGLLAPVAYAGRATNILRATAGTPFRYMANKLDEWAPGTSNIGVAIGNFGQFFIAGAFASAGLSLLKRRDMYKTIAKEPLDNLFQYAEKTLPYKFKRLHEAIKIVHSDLSPITPAKELFEERLEKKAIPFLENFGKHSRFVRFGLTAGIVATALSTMNIIGGTARLLGGTKTLSEVEAENSGSKNVPQYKSRWWMFGQSSIGGDTVDNTGPNWYQRMLHDYRGDTLFNKGEGGVFRAIKSTPILQDIVDPYYLERSHYKDIPYPVTGPDTSFGGIFGQMYGATIGKMLKPVTLMHTDEWAYPQNLVSTSIYKQYPLDQRDTLTSSYAGVADNNGYAPSLVKGGRGKSAIPIRNPYTAQIQISNLYSSAMEQVGLPGYMIRSTISNPNNWGIDKKELANAANLNSLTSQYWYQNFGDPAGYTEAIRRVLQNQKTHRDVLNPVQNSQPSWMPDQGYYLKFQHGDPYSKIYHGYERVPGAGLIERKEFKTLSNVTQEEYPDWAKLRILGDVAQNSPQFFDLYDKMKDNKDNLSKKEKNAIKYTEHEFWERATGRKFIEYKEDAGYLSKIQQYMNHLILPSEELIPLSPKEKFGNVESAVESYQHRVLWGNESANWARPWHDFFRPFLGRIYGGMLGGISSSEKTKRTNIEYFDYLKYVKYSVAAQKAEEHGDIKSALKMKKIAMTSTVAVNPYKPLIKIWSSISKEDRPYFVAFSQETDIDKRKKIINMVSVPMQRLYKARWELLDYANKRDSALSTRQLQKKIKFAKIREQSIVSNKIMHEIKHFQSVHGGKYKFPGEHWEGWSPRMSMTKIKISFLNTHNENPQDYRLRAVDIQEQEIHNTDYLFDSEYGWQDDGPDSMVKGYNILGKFKKLLPVIEAPKAIKRFNLYHDSRVTYRYAN